MLAYLLFVGRPPFKGPKHKIIYQIANNDVEYPINLDEVKKSLLQKMLAKNPNDRYDADSSLKEEYNKLIINSINKNKYMIIAKIIYL